MMKPHRLIIATMNYKLQLWSKIVLFSVNSSRKKINQKLKEIQAFIHIRFKTFQKRFQDLKND